MFYGKNNRDKTKEPKINKGNSDRQTATYHKKKYS